MHTKGFKTSQSQMLLLCFAGAAVVISVLLHTPCTPQTGAGGFCQAVSALGGCHCYPSQMMEPPEQS